MFNNIITRYQLVIKCVKIPKTMEREMPHQFNHVGPYCTDNFQPFWKFVKMATDKTRQTIACVTSMRFCFTQSINKDNASLFYRQLTLTAKQY